VVVERDARRDDVDEGRAFVPIAAFTSGMSCALSPEKLRATKVAPMMSCERHGVHWGVEFTCRASPSSPCPRSPRTGPIGQAVYAVVLEDVGHVHAAAHDVRELPQADRGRVAVAGHAEVDQVAVGEVGPRQDTGHSSVHVLKPCELPRK